MVKADTLEMPYFITDKSPECSGWATVKEDGEVMGCHTTKQAAIDQMLAVSLAEDMEPGGERALNDELEVGDYVYWDNGGNTMFGEITTISTYGPVKNPLGGDIDSSQNTPIATIQVYTNDNGVLTETQQFVLKGFAPLTKFDYEGQDEMQSEEDDAVRIESGPLAVIVDIDGTLISGGRLIEKTYAYIDDMTDTEIFIVTGRNDSERDSTIAELDSLGIDYDRLFMNPGSSAQTPEFKKATAETLLKEFNVILAIDNNPANRKVYRELGITALDVSDVPDVPSDQNNADEENARAINQDAPAYMRASARRGLAYYAEGKGGDGLVDKTIRDARLMADGQVSDDKWIAIAAWIARHLVDLDSPDANPNSDNYPSAGVVAHLLWGSGPSKRQAQRVLAYAQGVVERIRAEERSANDLQNEKWRTIALNLNKDERQQMTTTVERRVNTVEFDVRAGEASSDGMSFTGYAAVFNSPSEPLPFTEVIREGAFKRSLKSRNEIKLFMNHNTDVVLGSTRAGTLRLSEDSRGLLAQAELPDTSAGRDLSVLMKRGDVSSMSFGFSVPPKGDAWSSDGATRELHQVRLHEVSIVTGFPAYEATTASVRSLDILAQRTAVDVDALSDAILKLEAGETLDDAHADLIGEVVSKLRAEKPVDFNALEIKRKQLDLMAKVF
jgi:HK97 family phage prohead protease